MRAKAYTIGIACYSSINIVWLQSAPTAFANIGWKFYLFFIFFASFGALSSWFVFPDTLHKPLEEVAAMFGDHDLVMVYQKELDSAELPLESIEEIIPGLGSKRSPPDMISEKDSARGDVVESECISV